MAKFFEPSEGNSTDIVAGYQPEFVYEPCDVFASEAVSESPLDEAKTLEMFNLKTKIVSACALSFGRWEQSAVPVESHVFNTHAHGPSQLGESESLQDHLHVPNKVRTARPGQARYSSFGNRDRKVQMTRSGSERLQWTADREAIGCSLVSRRRRHHLRPDLS